jgi:hypothetical protein
MPNEITLSDEKRKLMELANALATILKTKEGEGGKLQQEKATSQTGGSQGTSRFGPSR